MREEGRIEKREVQREEDYGSQELLFLKERREITILCHSRSCQAAQIFRRTEDSKVELYGISKLDETQEYIFQTYTELLLAGYRSI